MDLVLANDSLADPGGTETYLVTVAESLTQLGHRATLHARTGGVVSEMAAGGGLMPGVEVGENAFVGARSLVTRSVPPGMLAHGSPARVIRPVDASLPWAR